MLELSPAATCRSDRLACQDNDENDEYRSFVGLAFDIDRELVHRMTGGQEVLMFE
jgi:hypothetical protein